MQLLISRKPGEDRIRREGYVIPMGQEAYKATGLEVASAINKDRGKNSILYIPIRDGGNSFGKSFEEALGTFNAPYLKLPAFVSKKLHWVLSPSQSQLAESLRRLRMDRPDYGVTAVIYDDTVDRGNRLLLMYGFLKDLQEDPRFFVNDIRLAACMDSRGITDYHSLSWTDERVDRDTALEELRTRTLGEHLTDVLYDFIPKRMPEPKDVVRRVMLL